MKRYGNPRKTLSFIFIASLLMIISDFLFYRNAYMPPQGEPHVVRPEVKIYERSEIEDFEFWQKSLDQEPEEQKKEAVIDVPQPEPIRNKETLPRKMMQKPAEIKINKDILTHEPAAPGKPGRIAIIIDDMGMNRKYSKAMVDLPAPVTLAFLPYAPQLEEMTKQALDKGHELLIHVPMEPMNKRLDPGPLALYEDMDPDDFDAAIDQMFHSFEGYVGINNHMGSKLTQNRRSMKWVMEALKKRGLAFIDSKTIPESVAEDIAASYGIAHAGRDIFLDNKEEKSAVLEKLHELESIARRRGRAIAIGHPKQATLEALQEWIPTLKEKNIKLVPVMALTRTSQPVKEDAYGPSAPAGPPAPPHE